MEADSPSIGEWTMEYATGDAQCSTEGNDLKQQTAPHHHAVDVVYRSHPQVKAIQTDIRKEPGKKPHHLTEQS